MLLLGESASREREVAARVALGASRARIVRQLLVESMTISALGATMGAALAWTLTRTLTALAPSRIAGIESLGVDLRALAFASLCASVSGVLFGLTPALALARSNEATLLRAGTGQSACHGRRVQRWLVAMEVALSFVLLFGAVLFSRSLDKLTAIDPGFRPQRLVEIQTVAPRSFYRDDPRMLAVLRGGRAAVVVAARRGRGDRGRAPAVQRRVEQFARHGRGSRVRAESRTLDRSACGAARILLGARHSDPRGTNVHRGGRNGLGARRDHQRRRREARFSESTGHRSARTLAGPIPPHRRRRRRRPHGTTYAHVGPAIYVPMPQYMGGSATFIVRTSLDLAALAPALRTMLGGIDPAVSVSSVERIPTLISRSYGDERYRTIIVGAFALFAAISRAWASTASRCAPPPVGHERSAFASRWAPRRAARRDSS